MSHHGNMAALIDVAAGLAVLGSLVGYLPDIAAGLAIVWYIVQLVSWLRGKRGP